LGFFGFSSCRRLLAFPYLSEDKPLTIYHLSNDIIGYYRGGLTRARSFMSRRLAVLLTSPHSTSTSSLLLALPALSLEGSSEGRTFCTLLQKSEAHPLTFQSFARSLQKRRG